MTSEIRTNNLKSRAGLSTVILSDTGPVVTGIATFGVTTKIDGNNNVINVGTALTIGHTQGVQFHTQNLHSTGFEVNQVNASGIITASSYRGDGSQLTGISAGFSPDAQGNLVAGTDAGASFSGTDANHNILIGYEAGNALTTADNNVAIGYEALKSADTEGGNVAIGYRAMKEMTGFGGNVCIGYEAGYYTYGLWDCVAIGANAMQKPVQSGYTRWSVAVGVEAMEYCGASNCVAIGYQALLGNNAVNSVDNTAVGYQSLTNITTAALKNTAVGSESGKATTSGDKNIYIGYNAGNNAHTTGDNCIIIGSDAAASGASASNEVSIGNTSITKFRIPGLNYVNDAGKVGIGTDSPVGKLHIWSTGPDIILTDYNQAADNRNWLLTGANTQILRIQAQNDSYAGGGNLFDFYRSGNQLNEFRGMNGGNYWFTINNDTKKVGIGTDIPDHNLHVFQNAGDAVVTIESQGNGNHSALEFIRTSSGGDSRGAGSIYVTGDTGASEAKMHFGVGHNISHGQLPRMTIMGNGEVGINETNPTRTLHISSDDDLTSFTGTGYGTVAIENSQYDSGDYNAIDFTYSGGNNPVARIATKLTGSGSSLHFGTSINYASGITNEAFTIDPSGRVSIGENNGQTSYPFFVGKDLDSGGNIASFQNLDSTYSQSLSLAFNSNKDMTWSGGSGVGGFVWNGGTRGFLMQINGTTRLNINSVGRVRLSGVPGVAGSNLSTVYIESDGNLCTQSSLREYKTNIIPLSDTSWLYNLNPVTFDWKKKTEVDGENVWEDTPDGNGTQYGLIAEEVEAVKKEFCYYDNDNKLSGVHYDRLISPLIKAVQDLKSEINILQKQQGQIETLIQENISLRARVTNLEGN